MHKNLILIFLSILLACQPRKEPATFLVSGISDIDSTRLEAAKSPTNEANVAARRAALYRWWRFMWRQGMDMNRFDSLANLLINNNNDSEIGRNTVSAGFKRLDQMWMNPEYIQEIKGSPKPSSASSTTNWPVYHGVDGTQSGFSPDKGPSEGKVVWKFPKTNGWKASAVLHNGQVYTSGAGTDVVAFCLDQKTGNIIWKGRTYSDSYYNSAGAKTSPIVSGNSLITRTGANLRAFNLETGEKKYVQKFFNQADSPQVGTSIVSLINNRGVSCNDPATGNMIWYFSPSTGKVTGEPAVTDAAVYVSSTENICYKLDRKDGSILWEKSFNETIRGNTSLTNDLILVGFKSGQLVAISAKSGDEVWRFKSNKNEPRAYDFYSSAISSDGKVYIGGADKFLYCLDVKTGSKLWEYEVNDWIRAKPIILDHTLFVADLSSIGYGLDITGNEPKLIWKEKISNHGIAADLSGNQQGILFSDTNMMLTSVNPSSGKKQWIHSQLDGAWMGENFFAAGEISGQQSSPTIVDGILYIASPDGFVNAVDTESGKEIWKFETKSSVSPSPTVAEGKVFVGQTYESYGEYFALDKDTGEPIWSSKELGSVWISAAYANGKLFLGDMIGNFFAIDPNTGKKFWNYFTAKDTPNESRPLDESQRHGWPPGVYCNPITDGIVVYVGSWSGYYFAFDQDTGKLLWRTKTQPEGSNGGLPDSSAPVLHKNHIYVQKAGHYLTAINKSNGEIVWDWFAPKGFLQNGTVAAYGDKVYGSVVRRVTSLPYNASIYAFQDVEGGSELLWKYKGGGGLTAPVMTRDKLIFGSSADPFVTCLNPDNGEVIWRTHVGGKMLESVPSIYGNKAFALIKNGYLYAFE
ncbi:MAG: PQQ-binding-like beta-propeller repeat protein [Cyclobacteriaceae bacterium]